ncbi:unnamed protein product [Diamesa tonsa]
MSKRRFKTSDPNKDATDVPPMSRLFVVCSKTNNEDDFRNNFTKFGNLEEVRILKDRDGESKGVAYLKFSKTSQAALACEEMNGKTIGKSQRPIKVMIAASRQTGQQSSKSRDDEKSQRLFIIIPKELSEDQLYEEFGKYGEIENVSVIRDRATREGKGFAYIKFKKFSSAALAFESCDSKYRAVFAEPKPFKNASSTSSLDSNNGNNGNNNFAPDDRYDNRNSSGHLMGLGSSGGPDLLGNHQHTDCVLNVICSPMVSHDQLWRLFDIVPNMDYCKMNKDFELSSSATVVYSTPQSALHARQKLHGFEYPPGERLIVKFNNVANRETSNFCSVTLPPVQPLSKDTTVAQRCFIVCSPHTLPVSVLKQAFCRFGNLIDVYLLSGRNCGYVKFSVAESAKQAMTILHGAEIYGVRLKVLEAEEPRSDQQIQPKNYEGSEKRFRQQLEPSKKSSYTYEYNTMAPDYGHQVSFPHHQALYENHYHEPQLAITYSVPIDQRSPLEKLNKVANTNTSYGSRKLQSDTISSSTESLNSTQVIEIESSSTSLMNEKQQPKSNMIEQMVTSNGGWLELEHLETSLSIPELTFERTRKYNIFLTVLHNEFIKNQITCNFNDNSTHLSSIIYCGPSEVLLNKPVILKFPHCASHFENWTISLLHNKCANDNQKAYIDMDDEKDKWTRIASTNNDVVNPQAFIQLDTKNAFIISRVLGKLLLVGESKAIEQGVDKRMKIALFGPKHKMPAGDFNIRIYIVEDYPSSINYCTIIEKNLGNDLLVESKDFLFKNNKEDLFVQLVCSGGWQTRNESQKIPYSHVWKNSYLIHCDFLLEKCNNNVNKLNMEIFVKQKHGNDIFLNNLLFYS